MKILYLITQSEWGGAQKYVFDLASSLKGEFGVIVASGNGPGELGNRLRKENIDYRTISSLRREISPWNDFWAIFEIYALIRKERPDIVHTNSSKAGFLGNLAARIAKTPKIIYTAHGFVFNEPLGFLKKIIYISLERITALCAHKIICVSEYDRRSALDKKLARKEKFTTIHNGIRIDGNISNTKNAVAKTPDKFIITTIANFYPNKGIPVLIEAARLLNQEFTDLEFWLIGDGQERKTIEKLIRKHSLSNVILHGFQKHPEKFLQSSDLFILPSLKEGFPYVILEAMQAGLPIIASRVGGIPEIVIEKENGFLVSPADSKKLAEKISFLKKNTLLRKSMSQSNRKKVEDFFSMKIMIEKTRELL